MSGIRFDSVLVLVVFCLTGAVAGADEPVAPETEDGQVDKVILYRGQARVFRTIPLDDEPRSIELVVTNLPQRVVPDSLFAEGSPGVEVRAVRYRKRAVGEEPREEVRELDQQIAEINEQLELISETQKLIAKRMAYLDQLEGFVAPTATVELSKGVLNAETLAEITRFSFEQREAAMTKTLELKRKDRALKRELEVLKRRLAMITTEASRAVHEAILFLENRGAAGAWVRIGYLVNQ